MFSIYIHIPFCIQKCLYCDFLSGPAGESDRESYLNALRKEIETESAHYRDREVHTVFLGGGTPSVLTADQTAGLFDCLRSCFRIAPDAEITTELNPGTVTADKLEAWRGCGINRLSVGLQSADDEELKMLGRIHTWQEFTQCWHMAREYGFANMSVDLMSALPDQTAASWERTLRRVCRLPAPPEHISAYSLIVEENTPFYSRFAENAPEAFRLPEEEEDRLIYHRTKEILAEYGYARYEISNYAKVGRRCLHNCAYWKGTEYIGLGLGASSMVNHVRWRNEDRMEPYIERLSQGGSVRGGQTFLTENDRMEEFCFLGLRLMEGISRTEFEHTFGVSIDAVYGRQIAALAGQGLLEEAGDDRLRLTDYGIDVSNYVFSRFLLT